LDADSHILTGGTAKQEVIPPKQAMNTPGKTPSVNTTFALFGSGLVLAALVLKRRLRG